MDFDKFRKKPSKLDDPIAKILSEMEVFGPGTPEYDHLLDQLDRLIKMQSEERRNRVSPDTLATVGGNLLGILVIVAYEQKHVVVSKALNMLQRTSQPR